MLRSPPQKENVAAANNLMVQLEAPLIYLHFGVETYLVVNLLDWNSAILCLLDIHFGIIAINQVNRILADTFVTYNTPTLR